MKLTLLLLATVLFVSCGNNQGNGSGPSIEEQNRELYLDVKNQSPSELLNATLSVSADVRGGAISFSTNRIVQDSSGSLLCRLAVERGETWRYSLHGNNLLLQLPNGKNLTLKKVHSIKEGLIGSWAWKGQENGMKIHRRYTFLPDMVVVNQDCEG